MFTKIMHFSDDLQLFNNSLTQIAIQINKFKLTVTIVTQKTNNMTF